MNIELLLSRLDKVRQTGPSWMACCPAHEDRSPSLRIRQAEDRILLYCLAGCHAEDVIAAVGLTWADLYDRDRASYERAVSAAGRAVERAHVADPLDLEQRILEIARADLAAGKELSVEDRARVELAAERLEGAK